MRTFAGINHHARNFNKLYNLYCHETGGYIYYLRCRLGLSQTKAARLAQVSQNEMYGLEHSDISLPPSMYRDVLSQLIDLCRAAKIRG